MYTHIFLPSSQLPSELQHKVRTYMSSKRRTSDCNGLPPKVERRTIKVPIPTFPPTAMVYSVNKAPTGKFIEFILIFDFGLIFSSELAKNSVSLFLPIFTLFSYNFLTTSLLLQKKT